MKAAIYTKYGPPEVLSIKDIPKPIPKDDEILIKIHATTVTSGDRRMRASDFPPLFWIPARLIFGLFKPKKKILGHEFSGIVEAKGKGISKFNIGDEVFGTTTMLKAGSYAEYVCVPEQWKYGVVGHKPASFSFKEAAALPIGGMTALFLLDKANVTAGQNVLIYGASGSVGTYAVQIARVSGASVTGVCSTSNLDMVRSIGAEHVIDYKKEDFTSVNDNFDIVFDAVGKISKSVARNVIKPGGQFVSVNMLTNEKIENLLRLKNLAESGDIKPIIDRTYPLDEIVDAHTYVDTGRKRGNVVIIIE